MNDWGVFHADEQTDFSMAGPEREIFYAAPSHFLGVPIRFTAPSHHACLGNGEPFFMNFLIELPARNRYT